MLRNSSGVRRRTGRASPAPRPRRASRSSPRYPIDRVRRRGSPRPPRSGGPRRAHRTRRAGGSSAVRQASRRPTVPRSAARRATPPRPASDPNHPLWISGAGADHPNGSRGPRDDRGHRRRGTHGGRSYGDPRRDRHRIGASVRAGRAGLQAAGDAARSPSTSAKASAAHVPAVLDARPHDGPARAHRVRVSASADATSVTNPSGPEAILIRSVSSARTAGRSVATTPRPAARYSSVLRGKLPRFERGDGVRRDPDVDGPEVRRERREGLRSDPLHVRAGDQTVDPVGLERRLPRADEQEREAVRGQGLEDLDVDPVREVADEADDRTRSSTSSGNGGVRRRRRRARRRRRSVSRRRAGRAVATSRPAAARRPPPVGLLEVARLQSLQPRARCP